MTIEQIKLRLTYATTLTLFTLGLLCVGLAMGAPFLNVDNTPGFGMIQMMVFLIGLTLLTLAGFLQISTLRQTDTPRSLQADIGIRLGATGLVFAYISGLSDLLGIGTHIEPNFARPSVGWLQLIGLGLAIVLITLGMVLFFTSRGNRRSSSLEFLLERNQTP
jgi:uncharacterized membrane protein